MRYLCTYSYSIKKIPPCLGINYLVQENFPQHSFPKGALLVTSNECKVYKYSRVLIACSCAKTKTKTKALVRSGCMTNEPILQCIVVLRPGSFVTGFIQNKRKEVTSNWRRGSMSLKSPWALEGNFQVPIFRQRKIKTSRHHTAKKSVEERLTSVYSQTQAKPVAGRKKALFTFKATSQVSRKIRIILTVHFKLQAQLHTRLQF